MNTARRQSNEGDGSGQRAFRRLCGQHEGNGKRTQENHQDGPDCSRYSKERRLARKRQTKADRDQIRAGR